MNMHLNKTELALVNRIARRANTIYKKHCQKVAILDIQMDITACHLNGCPLDLNKLAAFDDFNLMHDVQGIKRHLNRTTGRIHASFLPRSAVPSMEVRVAPLV